MQLPKALKNPPLVEALFEIRFDSTVEAAGDLLPGLLYGRYKPKAEPSALQLANLPREFRGQDPALRYAPLHRLQAGSAVLQVGDHVAALSHTDHYPGWRGFRKEIHDMVDHLASTELIASIERFSLRYINVLPVPEGSQLAAINGEFKIGGTPIPEPGFMLRYEARRDGMVTIIQMKAQATVERPKRVSGLILDLDAICPFTGNISATGMAERLDRLHDWQRSLFLDELLTKDALSKLEPMWG